MKSSLHPSRLSRFSLAALALAGMSVTQAYAVDGAWGVDASGNWNDLDTANWSALTVATGLDGIATFANDITADRVITLDTAPGRTIGKLVFGDLDTATAGSWTIAGANPLTLDVTTAPATITVNALGAGKSATIATRLISNDGLSKLGAGELILSGSDSVITGATLVSAGTMRLSAGSIAFRSSATAGVANATTIFGGTMSIAGANVNVVNGASDHAFYIGNPAAAGTGTLNISSGSLNVSGGRLLTAGFGGGTGNVNISGTAFVAPTQLILGWNGTGNSTMSGGFLTATDILHRDAGTGTFTMTGGFVSVNRFLSDSGNAPTTLNFNGGLVRLTGGAANFVDTIKNQTPTPRIGNAGATFDTAASVSSVSAFGEIAGSTSGTPALTKLGTGTITLRGTTASTYSGETRVLGGALDLEMRNLNTPVATDLVSAVSSLVLGGGTLNVRGRGDAAGGVLNGTFVATANLNRIVSGLSSTAGLIAGQGVSGTGIPAGTTVAQVLDNTRVLLSANATVAATATPLTFDPYDSTSSSQTFSSTKLRAGANAVLGFNGSAGNVTTVNLATVTRDAGATLNVATAVGSGDLGTDVLVQSSLGNDAGGIVGGWATGNSADWLTVSSGNLVPISSYQLATNAASWAATDNVSLSTDPDAALDDTTVHSLRFSGPSTVSVNAGKTLKLTSGGILNTLGGNTIAGGTLTGVGNEVFIMESSVNNLTINSVIADNTGATSVTKAGAGKLIVNGQNIYTGATYLNSGILRVAADSVGTAGAVTSGPLGRGDLVISGGALTSNGAITRVILNPVTINGDATLGDATFPGQLTLSAPVTLKDFSRTLNVLTPVVVNGSIGEAGGAIGVTKSGPGRLTLNAANTFTGTLTVAAGQVRLGNANALPGGTDATGGTAALLFTGTGGTAGDAVVELTSDFQRPITTTANGVLFLGSGGFGAVGGTRTVNFGSNAQPLVWGVGGFGGGELRLSSTASDGTVVLANPISVNGATRVIRVADGSAAIDAEISSTFAAPNGGSLQNFGPGLLVLSGANNVYGNTFLYGNLRPTTATSLSPSVIQLNNGGVLELTDALLDGSNATNAAAVNTFTRPLAGGLGGVIWGANTAGGFGAVGADKIVNFGNTAAPLTWGGTASFITNGALVLSSPTSNAKVTFVHALNLNAVARTVTVANGSAPVDAELSGALTNGVLVKDGAGTLALTATGTTLAGFNVNAGTVTTTGTQVITGTAGTTVITIAGGATWNQAGGVTTTNNYVSVGGGAGTGTLTINGSSQHNNALELLVGLAGSGTLNIADTAVVQTIYTRLGGAGNGTLNLDGGTLTTDKVFKAGGAGSSTANLDGGILKVRATAGREADWLIFMQGLDNTFIEDGGVTFDTNGKTIVVAQPLQHDATLGALADGGLTKQGNGTLTLSGNSTYTGDTRVNVGHLRVTGTLTGSTVNVNTSANFETSQTLPGLNIADGAVVTLGALAPAAPALASSAVQAVPEPGSATLLVAGLCAMLGMRYRHKLLVRA